MAASGLAGCCCRGAPISQIQAPPPNPAGLTPILKPLRMSTAPKPGGIKYCLDAHTHFFNASDINAKGYFDGGVVRDYVPGPLQDFARAMSPLIDKLTEAAPTAREEFDLLLDRSRSPRFATLSNQHPLQSVADAHRAKIAGVIAKAMHDNKLDVEFLRLRTSQAQRFGLSLPTNRSETFDATILNVIDHQQRRRRQLELSAQASNVSQADDPGGIVEFIGHMLSYRFMNIRDYQQFYTEDNQFPGIDGVFNALVDFDLWLDCPTESSREDQVKVQSLLSLLSGGYMLPLVSYNPWTDIAHDGASLDLVKRAIAQYGFVGAKIYPSNGFFAYGNSYLWTQVKTSQRHPDLVELDKRLLAMFEWCATNNVPVMAHGDESMGADSGADEFGGPKGWTALLDKMRGATPPIINIGHFGGDVPPPGHTDNHWPAEIAALFDRVDGRRVYVDLGFWTALCTCGTPKPDDLKTAIGRLKGVLGSQPEAANRIMYGSDWYMISTQEGWETYARDLMVQLAPLLPPERLFYQNVIDCYGLGRGGAQRDRVLAFFSGVAGGPPNWLTDALIS
jgi:predicted TIM-barrel fold metal-dependent hydrolase